MDLSVRETAFVFDVMGEIENSEGELPTARSEAARIREKAERSLAE